MVSADREFNARLAAYAALGTREEQAKRLGLSVSQYRRALTALRAQPSHSWPYSNEVMCQIADNNRIRREGSPKRLAAEFGVSEDNIRYLMRATRAKHG